MEAGPPCAPSLTQCPSGALAGRTEVVIVADEAEREDELDGIGIGQHPARHGVDVKINRIIREKIDVADALLLHAADSGADLIAWAGMAIRDCASSFWVT